MLKQPGNDDLWFGPAFQVFKQDVFAEPFGPWHVAAFVLIWTALALYSATALVQDNARRRAARAAAASGTAV